MGQKDSQLGFIIKLTNLFFQLEGRKDPTKLSIIEEPKPNGQVYHQSESTPELTTAELIAEEEARDKAVSDIQAAIQAHYTRSKAVTSMRSRIHVARPWLKKKTDANGSDSTTSEDELDRVCETIQGVIQGHETRRQTKDRLEADAGLFQHGKVSAIRAKFNERRAKRRLNERSDGVTDDDDDVVY